jgi:hypothetical protein
VSPTYLSASLREQVRDRAGHRCEYCLLGEDDAHFPHEPDHIIAEKHGGTSSLDNLAPACFDCNRFKGSNIASIEPETNELIPLFNPRMQEWPKHFAIREGAIIPTTAIGRVTVLVLRLNLLERVETRELLAEIGEYPATRD